ncbi:signal peptidase I [Halalkalibacter sp. APA_J-10(15)]|uniref:signal peptidase I n=1 Tax=Halalkalibacter sp. APA_J-10(15) TaxID=2933805 RepID=UPI001FF4E457|nr:signal peptidase I [Halalkalibacter sp. APA_J-10(15)]MCK0473848.1 signal peptidase I [Halalkalibacter sp. APA_J-10(15)]
MKNHLFLPFTILSFLLFLVGCNSQNDAVYKFEGMSMEPTISDGDKFEVDKNYFQKHDIKTGDIVVFKMNEDITHTKRVIGLPGELIEINSGEITIDGKPLNESFIFNIMHDSEQLSMQLGEDEYFLIGDQPLYSKDSRQMGLFTKKSNNWKNNQYQKTRLNSDMFV